MLKNSWHRIIAQKALTNQSLDQDFYQGKLMAMRYFFEYELVKMDGLGKRLVSDACRYTPQVFP